MKAVLVVKMKEGYLALPYSGVIAGIDPTNGRAVERTGYDNSGIGKAVVAVFQDQDIQGEGRSEDEPPF